MKLAALGCSTAFCFLLGAAQVRADATAYVVHGIPGEDLGADAALPVDVSVNGDCFLESFEFGDIVGPVALPAGAYDIAISLANAAEPCSNAPVIEANGVQLEDGINYSIVAYLDETGGPTAGVFENNMNTRLFRSTVNVFHTAAAPAVDVRFKRAKRFFRNTRIRNLENGEAASRKIFRGSWDVSISPAGTRQPVFGPATLNFEADKVYLAFAVGSLENDTLTVLLTEAEDAPSGDAEVVVVHGIPGIDLGVDPALPVDVSVNGICVLEGFEFQEVAGPLALTAGTYDVAISLADADNPCGNDPVIEANGVELQAGECYSLVAQLTEDAVTGDLVPVIGAYINEKARRGIFAKVNIFHAAAAPTVDVELERSYPWWWPVRSLNGVSNSDNGALTILFGWWNAWIFPAGGDDPVFGPAPLGIAGGTTYLVYAVGSLENDTFTLIVDTLPSSEGGGSSDDDDDDD